MITSYDSIANTSVKVTAKQKAQEELLFGLQVAFVRYKREGSADVVRMTPHEKDLVWVQMDKQMSRVEKLFGFEPRSWERGC